MSDARPPTLFDDGGSAPAEPTFGVYELNDAVRRALRANFPGEVWVRGEITGVHRSRYGHTYFDLVEKDGRSESVRGRLPVALLANDRWRVDRDLKAAPDFSLQDGIEVRVRGRVDVYPPTARLQLRLTGVDPAFTLGRLAANRVMVLRRLQGEGLLERNGRLPVPMVPLRIGLVTSVGSAAYNDFCQELRRSRFGFRVRVIDARMQGQFTERSVVAALRRFARMNPDVVVIVRGGGSRSDLAWFDSDRIARTIATMPCPVLTGIGHEVDRSIADEVAHTAFKTPTACAAWLAGAVQTAGDRVEAAWSAIGDLAGQRLAAAEGSLGVLAGALVKDGRTAVRTTDAGVEHRAARIAAAATSGLQNAGARLKGMRESLHLRGGSRLHRDEDRLERVATALDAVRLERLLSRCATGLDGFEARARALDPTRVLARGYSITRVAGGGLVLDAASVATGSRLRTTLAHGGIDSEVIHIEDGGTA